MNNILITGGAGYVGTAILKIFKDLNYNITIYDNLLYGGSSLLPFIGSKKISFVNMFKLIEMSLEKSIFVNDPSLEDYLYVDSETRKITSELISKI